MYPEYPLSLKESPFKKAFSKKPDNVLWQRIKGDAVKETMGIYESLVSVMNEKTSDNW
ncbi:MAG TPA: hypothetical protein VGB84_06690 [Arachidicoccus sp.]